jgi:ankyrin repeat protein
LVRVLLDHGANANVEDSQGWTPLHHLFAIPDTSKDVLGVVRLLFERGADVNAPNTCKDHVIPLHFASYRRHLELVRALLDHGANVHAEDVRGWTPFYHVFANPDTSKDVHGVAQLLLERGADVNTPDKDHSTPLHLASSRQRLDLVQVLLDNGANVNAKDIVGRTPLHRIFGNSPKHYPGDCATPHILLKHGADVNARDGVYDTPLHMALRLGWFEGPWVLLEYGADLSMVNKEGMTPFRLVQEIMREEMKAAPLGHFDNKQMIAERVVLLSLLHE